MKKWTYLLSGIVIGAMLATAGSALAGPIKSLVGQKVTGELSVVVNGKELPDKGAVISGRTNVPVRGIVDALGAQLTLKDGVITVTTKSTQAASVQSDNPYIGKSKAILENIKGAFTGPLVQSMRDRVVELENSVVTLTEALSVAAEQSKDVVQKGLDGVKKELSALKANLADNDKKLEQVNEALLLLDK